MNRRRQKLGFFFATGIESSNPTIDHGRTRVDEYESCGHYRYWREDFALLEEMGIPYLRYGPPIHRTYIGPNQFDWEFSDLCFSELRHRGVVPIVELCHFGVPDWIGNFQNPDFPELFARYAVEFAKRYPWVQLYTPISEMYICALFSAFYGWWNEQLTSHRSFVTALHNIVKANVLAMRAILQLREDAIFVQSESSEYFHASSPACLPAASFRNTERFLSLDLNYGRRINSEMYEYLLDNGMSREQYHFFLEGDVRHHCVLGNDYYVTNEHRVHPDGTTGPSGEVFGYAEITRQYYARYKLPVMHTETNFAEGPRGDEVVDWLWKQWANVMRVRNDGVPIVGFTWNSLHDQIDWDIALREKRGRLHLVGLFTLDRQIRPVGRAYKQLISDWEAVLPTKSVCLQIPLTERDAAGELHVVTPQAESTVG